MKRIFFNLLRKNRWLLKKIIRFFLKLYNTCYKYITIFSSLNEKEELHPKHRIMKYHQWFVDNIKRGWIVLDIGCGNGALSYDLATKKAKKVIGIDINKKNIDIAIKTFKSDNIKYLCTDINTYQFTTIKKFHCVILSNVLEHIKNRVKILKKASQLSKMILIRVPMINRDWITLYKREMNVEWRLDQTHYIEYTLEEFQNEIKKAGLKIKSYKIQWGELYAIVVK